MSHAEVTYCFIVILFAYTLRGGTGFGAAIAMPLLALVVPMKILVPAWSVLSVVAGIDILRRDYDKIAWDAHWDLPRQPPICRGERGEVQVASELDADSERVCTAGEIDNHCCQLASNAKPTLAMHRFDSQGWRFEVIDLDGRRIDKIVASRIAVGRRRAAV